MPNNLNPRPINSKSYWDDRFSNDWDENDGPAQSRFFARIALQNIPAWLLREIRREKLSVVDWGCAEGDGTDALAESIDRSQLTGLDFSEVAISAARGRYKAINFQAKNWLDENIEVGSDRSNSCFDVVFSSNTLEHFHAPYQVLERLAERSRKAIVLALPFRELDRIDEHHASFLPENIPSEVNTCFQLCHSKVVDCRSLPDTQWSGEQILLVYGHKDWLSSLNLVLNDISIEQHDTETKLNELQESVEVQGARLSELLSELERGQKALFEKDRLLSENDVKLAELEPLHNYVKELEALIDEIEASSSWRLTKPLRIGGQFVKSPLVSIYRLGKYIFWSLPPFMRRALQGPRHRLVRYFRGLPVESSSSGPSLSHNDLSWLKFKELILSKRDSYKGIFIQELVIDWNVPLYQRPQHISAAMGRLGFLVIYRTDNWAGDDVNGFREVADNVWITNRHEVDQIKGAVRSLYSTAYAHTPESVKKRDESGVLLYEYIDHIDPEISGDEQNIKRLLALKNFAFNGGADFIVASAGQLYDEAVKFVGEERVILAQNGVDTRHYRNPGHADTPIPKKLESFSDRYETVVGYFGALAPWLWYEALSELIRQRPDLGFVFIGPDYYGGAQKLPSADNVLYLGAVDYKILPAYARRFDVCFIPFKPGEIARTTSPLKLFEYFALEKPVVVTSEMRECVQYPEVFRGGSVQELSKALDDATAKKNDASFRERLAQLADENDWDQRAKAISVCFDKFEELSE